MLIVTGTIELAEDSVAAALAAAEVVMAETQKEDGCQIYEFSQVVGAPTRFRIYEEWDNEEALRAHFGMPHMAVFQKALSGLTILSRELYTVQNGVRAPL